jgi:Glycosyltransferases involved in cell wall biogenesis
MSVANVGGCGGGSPLIGFSVVIPLYNKERFVERAVESVLRQTWTNYEVVVVDDGSTDDGPSVVAKYLGPKVRLIRQRNSGVSAARNRGIAEARMPWIAFLDADDEYLPTRLERCAECIAKYPDLQVVYTGVVHRTVSQPAIPDLTRSTEGMVVDYLRFSIDGPGRGMYTSGVTVRKDVFAITGCFSEDLRISEDTDMWFRLGMAVNVGYIPAHLAIYHMIDGTSGWTNASYEHHPWVRSYLAWKANDRIPPHRRQSAERFYRFFLLSHAVEMARNRRLFAALVTLGRGLKGGLVSPSRVIKSLIKVFMLSCPVLRRRIS